MKGIRAIGTAAALLGTLALLPATATAASTDWLSLRTLNIAHQGGEDEAPSNTMYAYARALRLGSDMLELDVHTTRDGKVVVIHDATVDRTTNGSGRVYDMKLKQLQRLDAGYYLVPGEGAVSGRAGSAYPFRGVRTGERMPPPSFERRDFRIPTLAEVLRAYPNVPTNIEIKGAADDDIASYLRNAEALAALLNRIGRTRGLMVVSFKDEALAHFHELAPEIDMAPATGAVANYILNSVLPPPGTRAFQVPMSFSGIPVTTPEFIDQAHADGYAVHVWTINDEPTMRQLIDWGADGTMTAEPARLERILCRTDTARPARPRGSPGRHCNTRVSIACEVRTGAVQPRGGVAIVTLARVDDFDSRCAGRLRLRGLGTKARSAGRFNFGWRPPSDGGPSELTVTVGLRAELRDAIERTGEVRVRVQPYGAFIKRELIAVD